MMLLTLVENALKHGLGPLPEGGQIRVSAALEDGQLVLEVADTGRGLIPGSGGGTGLANIRARLKATYGDAAALNLRLNEPRGVLASIVLQLPGDDSYWSFPFVATSRPHDRVREFGGGGGHRCIVHACSGPHGERCS